MPDDGASSSLSPTNHLPRWRDTNSYVSDEHRSVVLTRCHLVYPINQSINRLCLA